MNAKIEFFFQAPATPPERHAQANRFSVLYLLRREMLETAGFDPDTEGEPDAVRAGLQRRLFASTILMFTCIDLLAKFYSEKSGVGARFKEFLQTNVAGGFDPATAELLWAVRNSLVHAFGIPDQNALQQLGMSQVALARRDYTPAVEGSRTIVRTDGEVATVFVDGLYESVTTAIGDFASGLYGEDAGERRAVFAKAFDLYGTITMNVG